MNATDFTLGVLEMTELAPGASTTFTVTFTPSSLGSRHAALHIESNVAGSANPFDINVTGTGLKAAENWRQTHFGSTANSGNAADGFDYDKDGLPNLIEWACNLNPTTASSMPAYAVRNGTDFEFTYTRSVAALNAGTVFTVEWSDTLVGNDWHTTGVAEVVQSNNGTVQQVKATLPTGILGHRFVHLKVTAAP